MRISASSVGQYLRESLWFTPILVLVLALAGAIGTVYLDTLFQDRLLAALITRDPEAARSVLTVVATAMLTFIALTFTITVVVLQLAASQYSPRITRSFLRDRQTKLTMGLFLGTFAYALLVLRSVRSADGGFVPSLSVSITYLLVFASLLAFIAFLNHIAQAIRVSNIVRRLAREADQVLSKMPARLKSKPASAAAIDGLPVYVRLGWNAEAGVLVHLKESRLVRLAARADCAVRVLYGVGDFIPRDADVLEVLGTPKKLRAERWLDCLAVNPDRTPQQDLSLSIRDLVDVALRALSPSLNDPTTAVQAIDYLHDLLRRIAVRALPSSLILDREGTVRVLVPRMSWDAYLSLAMTEIRRSGVGAVQVTRRLLAMLDDLLEISPEDRHPAIERERALLLEGVGASFSGPDREAAGSSDAQGLGHRAPPSPGSEKAAGL